MSSGLEVLSLKSDDMLKMLAVSAHTGSENLDYQMEQYIFKRTASGTHIINLRKTWEKLLLAARAIVAIKNPSDVYVISTYPKSQRATLKFSSYTGATPIAGRFTPGTFTNQIQKNFKEPLLLIVADPYLDHQPIAEASFVNIPVIGFCNAETPMKFVDIAIPCNNKSVQCIGLMFWMLAREVLRFRGMIPRTQPWDVMPDLFFYREPEEVDKDAEGEKTLEAEGEAQNVSKIPDAAALLQNQWASSGFNADTNVPASHIQSAMSPAKTQPPMVEDEWMTHPQLGMSALDTKMPQHIEASGMGNMPGRVPAHQYMQQGGGPAHMGVPSHHFEQPAPGPQHFVPSHHQPQQQHPMGGMGMNIPGAGAGYRGGPPTGSPMMGGMQQHHYVPQQHQPSQNYMLPEHLAGPTGGMHPAQGGKWPSQGGTTQEHKPIEKWGDDVTEGEWDR